MIISFNIPDAQVPRIRDWMLSQLPSIDANDNPITWTDQEILAEFKEVIRGYIRGQVQQYELLKQHEAVFAGYTPLDVTAS